MRQFGKPIKLQTSRSVRPFCRSLRAAPRTFDRQIVSRGFSQASTAEYKSFLTPFDQAEFQPGQKLLHVIANFIPMRFLSKTGLKSQTLNLTVSQDFGRENGNNVQYLFEFVSNV